MITQGIATPLIDGATTYALVTDQGTAMGEAALCSGCYPARANQIFVEDIAEAQDDWNPTEGWHDTSGNEALLCAVCGRDNEGNLPVEG